MAQLRRKRAKGMFLSFWLVIGTMWGQETKLDPAILQDTKALILLHRMPDETWTQIGELRKHPDPEFAQREIDRIRPEYERRLHEQIRTRPGLKPYLYYLLDYTYRVNSNPDYLGRVLDALAERDDLKSDDVDGVRQEVAKIFANPVRDFEHMSERMVQHQFLKSSMAVLARDPTPSSEKLMLEGLAWPHEADVNVLAAEALANAGVTRAIPEMEATLNRLTTKSAPFTDDLRKAIDQLKMKLTNNIKPGAVSPNLQAPVSTPVTKAHADEMSKQRVQSWPWILGIAFITVVTWLLLKHSSQRKTDRKSGERGQL